MLEVLEEQSDQISLVDAVESIRVTSNSMLDEKNRGKLGQFMTSGSVAMLMASMFDELDGVLDIIDAGAGVGSLTSALIARALLVGNVSSINSTSYEVDPTMLNGLKDTLNLCREECEKKNIRFGSEVIKEDFIQSAVSSLSGSQCSLQRFNKAILNPPYLKIGSQSKARRMVRKVGVETGNLYSAFVALTIKLLEDGGELVAITPRSFCNGPYFKDFRNLIFKETAIKKLHVFNSRTKAFKGDNVLQENVIFHLVKGGVQGDIIVSSSESAEDDVFNRRVVPVEDVVNITSEEKFIHIASTEEQAEISRKMNLMPCGLSDLGISVSTGRVVDFRTKENLVSNPGKKTVPLIYPLHFKEGVINWPIEGCKKPNAIKLNNDTINLMVPEGDYVLVKRLSSKEEKRRIVASVYLAEQFNDQYVGFDNKTNYFHKDGVGLNCDVVKGLSLYLNSGFVDNFFRQFNGHTQVNAADLRSLRYPSLAQLKKLGAAYSKNILEQRLIDSAVAKVLEL